MALNSPDPQDLIITSLRGGQNDTDSATMLKDDECVLAENVEFFESALGERRLGCGPLDITNSHLDDEDIMVYFTEWAIDNEVLNPQIFAISATPTVSYTVAVRTNLVWAEVAPANIEDAFSTTVPAIYHVSTQALNGLLFVAYRSGVDRMHVWDGTNLRRAGLAAPPNPLVVTNTAVAGTYTGTRYFRFRVAQLDGSGNVLRQSEPSATTTFAPAGVFDGAIVTRPGTYSNDTGVTDWILEASTDDALYYQIATIPIATTFYTDHTVYATGYSSQGPLSPQIGDYDTIPSAKFVAADGDRLVFAGHWTDESQMSLVGWTPVQTDPGVGNSQRLPLDVDNTKNLDNYAGGPLVGLSAADYGTLYAFKFNRVYRLMRTSDVTNAYDVICLSTSRGAVEGSIVRGYTEDGSSCIYFLDPLMGPSRVGSFGIQSINGLRGTWGTVNLDAQAVVACGCFYPYKQQLHWWVATDGSDRPNFKMVLQVSELRVVDGDAVGRGWSTATGRITEAACCGVLTETVSINGVSSISERPFAGMSDPDFMQRCDTEDEDAGVPYSATIITRPYILAGQLNMWGAMVASLLAMANSNYSVKITLIKDFGAEENMVITDLTPDALETQVFKMLDNLRMSEARSIQVKFEDP